MPEIRVITPPTAEAEPVTLALLKQHVRVDGADEDELLQLYLGAAREKVEAYTGRYYAAQRLGFTFCLGEAYELPAGATAISVSGAITDLADLETIGDYLVNYQKGIIIERQLPLAAAFARTYEVVADATGDVQFLGLAKRAILELAGEWYKNRETTADARGLTELPVSWRVTLAEARVTVLGFS